MSVTCFFSHLVFSTISHSYVWSHSLPPKCTRLMHLKLKIIFLPQQHASGPPRMVQRPATKVSRNPLRNIKNVYCQRKPRCKRKDTRWMHLMMHSEQNTLSCGAVWPGSSDNLAIVNEKFSCLWGIAGLCSSFNLISPTSFAYRFGGGKTGVQTFFFNLIVISITNVL